MNSRADYGPNEEYLMLDNNVWGLIFNRTSTTSIRDLLNRLVSSGVVRAYKETSLILSPFGTLELLGISLKTLDPSWDAFVTNEFRIASRQPAQESEVWDRVFDSANKRAVELLGEFSDLSVIKARSQERRRFLPEFVHADFDEYVTTRLELPEFMPNLIYCIKMEIILGSDVFKSERELRRGFEIFCLLYIFQKGFGQPIFRTVKSIFETLLPGMRREIHATGDTEEIAALEDMVAAMTHKRVRDLVDSELLHLALAGKLHSSPIRYVKLVTLDPPKSTKMKLSYYRAIVNHTLTIIKNVPEFEDRVPDLRPGRIIFLSKDMKVAESWKVPS